MQGDGDDHRPTTWPFKLLRNGLESSRELVGDRGRAGLIALNSPCVVDRLPVEPGFGNPWTNIPSRYPAKVMMGRIAPIYAEAGGFSPARSLNAPLGVRR